jgi:hypothetical protein
VCGLSHYIEAEGVATVGLSLIREHTERMHPPRTLWVPFDLGRPFGTPNEPAFQMDVLRSLLAVLEQKQRPVIVDYPNDAPLSRDAGAACSCPLPLAPLEAAETPAELLAQALLGELSQLRPWFAESVRRRGRTTFGLSGFGPEAAPRMAAYLAAFAAGESPQLSEDLTEPMPAALRSMVDDLKAYYLEAAAAQPGASVPGAHRLNKWLYHETRLGQALYDIRDRLAAEAAAAQPDDGARRPPGVALIPNRYRERPAEFSARVSY